ncbi:MAG: single-stranded-DNA-specific exonuclease RecJ [Armatimonadetes bacterium]|nr:single-stranded-DNA-specific exonuclease RecJ [Armatimonadota bacterium]
MSMISALEPKAWRVIEPDAGLEAELTGSLPVSPVLRRILVNRGIRTLSEAQAFLTPDLDAMRDPSLLDGVDEAVERTRRALAQGEKIMIHGDYDVDGVTSTALLVRVFRILGADVSWYVPHRQREGYDIGLQAVETAKERGVGLIITADCGTSAVEPVARANSLGMDVIVTDHHEVGQEVAPALVMINPRKPGCEYPFKGLAGVGVAFKFAEALVRECGYDTATFRRRFCDLAAIGTVGDVVPLLDENRTLVKFGMQELSRTGKKGLKALLDVSGATGRPITSHMLAFSLAPRLNAAGRLDDAAVALDLLLTSDDGQAASLAQALELHNRDRQSEQERIVKEAMDQIVSRRLEDESKVFVLASAGWHPGVVGIVAGKIVDRFGRPAILVAVDETGEAGVGSARSIAAFDIFDALMRCSGLLDRCGGHSRAAGLSITMDRFSEFDLAINRIADELLSDSDLMPQLEVDAALDLDSVTHDLAYELKLLEPYGYCNREPVFMSERALTLHKMKMGSTGAHLKLKLGTNLGEPLECVAFGWGESEEAFRVGSLIDLCYNIQINEWGGRETVQMVLRDARVSEAVMSDPVAPDHAGIA